MNAVYARQSVDKLDSLSIETQIDSCVRSLTGEYTLYRDRGFSGKNTRRPAFQQMLRDIQTEKITKVWVYRLDRFSRSISDFGQLWSILEQHHVEFESVTEKFDTSTPSGRAMLNIIMAFAQLERETIAERVRDNYYHRFALGGWPGGPAPLGFDIGRLTDSEGRRVSTLTANDQAPLIQRIYRDYLQPGASLGSIARALTADNIPGIHRRSWDSVAISRILKNPVYVMANQDVYFFFVRRQIPIQQPPEAFNGYYGCHLVGKRDRSCRGSVSPRLSLANHAGFIPPELWLSCQKKLEQNRQLDRSHAGKYSWLSGLIKCARCGYAVKISQNHGVLYLHCSGHTNLNLCNQHFSVDLCELERAVEMELVRILALCPNAAPSPDTGRIRQLDAEIRRLLSAYTESTAMTVQYLTGQLIRLDRERRLLTRNPPVSGPRTMEFSSLSLAEKKMVASTFIDRILLSDHSAEVLWKI